MPRCASETLSAAVLQALQQPYLEDMVAPSFPASLRSCLQAVGDLQSAAQLLLLTVHSALLEAGLHLMQVSRAATWVFRVPMLILVALPRARAACRMRLVAAPGVPFSTFVTPLTDLCIGQQIHLICHVTAIFFGA